MMHVEGPLNCQTLWNKPIWISNTFTTKRRVSKKHKILFIKYTKFVKQNCITNCKRSSLTYYLTSHHLSTKSNELK